MLILNSYPRNLMMQDLIVSSFLRLRIWIKALCCFSEISVVADPSIIVMKTQQTWYNAALECRNKYHGHLLSSRDPIFEHEDEIKSLRGNATVWMGSYKTSSYTQWLELRGCFNVSKIDEYKGMKITSVHDCFFSCPTWVKSIALNKQRCFCNPKSDESIMVSMDYCSIDIDGEIYGNTRGTVALYKKWHIKVLGTTLKCMIEDDCKHYKVADCHSKSSFHSFRCGYGETYEDISWVEAQRYCVRQGSFLYTDQPVCSREATHRPSYHYYLRKYGNLQDLQNGTVYNSSEMSLCQTMRYNNGFLSQYYRCNDPNEIHMALCKSYITPSGVTTRTESYGHLTTTQTMLQPSSHEVKQNTRHITRSEIRSTVTSEESNPKTSSDASHDKNLAVVVGATIGVVVVVLILLLIIFQRKLKERSKNLEPDTNVVIPFKHSSEGNFNSKLQNNVTDNIEGIQQQSHSGPQNLENNYFTLEKGQYKIPAVYDFVHDPSEDNVNDVQHNQYGVQSNEYSTVSESAIQENIYKYDISRNSRKDQVNYDNHYDTAATVTRTFSNEKVVNKENHYDTTATTSMKDLNGQDNNDKHYDIVGLNNRTSRDEEVQNENHYASAAMKTIRSLNEQILDQNHYDTAGTITIKPPNNQVHYENNYDVLQLYLHRKLQN